MNWEKPLLEVGEERTVKRFAWRPIRINSKFVVWWEWYLKVQRVRKFYKFFGGWGTHWVNVDEEGFRVAPKEKP